MNSEPQQPSASLEAEYAKLEEKKPELLSAFSLLEDTIEDFKTLIKNVGIEKGLLVDIQTDDAIRVGDDVPMKVISCPVEVLSRTQQIIGNWFGSYDNPRSTPKKVAGVVKLNIDSDTLSKHISRINEAKLKVKSIIISIAKKADKHKRDHLRFYFLHNTCDKKSVVPQEIYRLLPFSNEKIVSVSFIWEKNREGLKHPKVMLNVKGEKQKKKHNTMPIFLGLDSPLNATYLTGEMQGEDKSIVNNL